ncbi:hypothetical protein DXG03_001313 [Asterophora parasitica]|uniref:Vacuolar protein sorting-associated protein 54 C-terminal domain-containing protein n=1 Tax=Asterophora parasitica TaxID=117018 RepID=A0A9P7KBM6_9AGAR|nr:hypothetical protein DXG03_001313 [Asterophora parasitica]
MSDDESVVADIPPSPISALPLTARPYRFTWDPAARRQGPESVAGTTDAGRGGGDYFSAQPRLGLFASGAAPILPQEWSSSKHGFHGTSTSIFIDYHVSTPQAISTVLNNPHKRQAPPKAHSALPAVVPADLPRVRRKDFDPYLRAIQPEWDRYQHNARLGREGAAQIDSSAPDHFASSQSIALPGPKNPPPLDTVPAVFFEPAFNIGDPRTFAAVTSSSSSTDSLDDPAALAHSLPLLEKFSHYADTVEQHLILEISLRSTSFFTALTNLHDLRAESEQCLTRIAGLRTLLKDLDTNSAKRGLQVVRRQKQATDLQGVAEGVRCVGRVVEMGRVARGLVGAGQWGEALGVIDEMQGMWEAEVPPPPPPPLPQTNGLSTLTEEHEHEGHSTAPDAHLHATTSTSAPKKPTSSAIPLSSLRAYAALPEHLRALTMEIAASLSSDLVSVLRADLLHRVPRPSPSLSSSLSPQNPSTGPENVHTLETQELDAGLKDRLRPLLQGLMRTRGVREGMLSWREVVLGVVKGVVAERLPTPVSSHINGNGDAKDSNATNDTLNIPMAHLKGMRHPEFMLLLHDIYAALLNCVEGLQAQGRVILEILEVEAYASLTSTTSPPFPVSAARDELADILSSATELANTHAAKLISTRLDEHASLPLADFLAFFNDSWAFVVRCEVLCRKMIVALRGAVVSQAKAFLQVFHQARISTSAKLVEDEQWNPAEVSPSLQHITDVLVDSAVRDAPELVIKSDTVESLSLTSPALSSTHNHNHNTSNGEPKPLPANGFPSTTATQPNAKHLRIEERTYFAVSATSEVLVLLLDYLRVVVNLTMLTTDTMSRVIEFLKAFNSRTCQVVLGAGAMRSAGLKNITAKHLALASQSLSIMFELIPYVRETFRRHLSPKQAVMLVEFDKLKRVRTLAGLDYQEHQNEIHSKLIAIMGDRLTAHIKSLQAVDWSVPKPGGGVNDYMEILVKEAVTLHKVLSRYLSIPVVEVRSPLRDSRLRVYVMTQVFAAINHGLSEEYGKIELPHQEAKTRLLADAKFLHQKLSALKNVGTPSNMLVTVISEKSLPRAAPPSPAAPTPSRASTLGLGASANQRLKGLLSGKSTTANFDKALPTPVPVRTSSLAASSPSSLLRPTSPGADNGALDPNANGGTTSSSSSSTSLSTPHPHPYPVRRASAGFKQVEIALPRSESPELLRASSSSAATRSSISGPGQADTSAKRTSLDSEGQRLREPEPEPLPVPPHDSPSPPPSTSPPAPELPATDVTEERKALPEPETKGSGSGSLDPGREGEKAQGVHGPASGAAAAAPPPGTDALEETDSNSGAAVPSQSSADTSDTSDTPPPHPLPQ